ncbi:TonB-dependent receptor [Marinimicrobium sp. ABcell2]|uniref:TonB-dependent receptor n=1 Tax=Marinimicrobium sp. ABcell2 TaxID=3069751 RepID=UPI0027B27BF4|nr:TonB-dependent receptor [Marinimicrobium sp. ABcell2]MDQ2077315.1 TonB-dependent receptor [Marinimicrobium sp. ABcell2]
MIKSKRLLLPSAIGCIMAGAMSVPAVAQDDGLTTMEEVVVTGIRRSLMNSLNIKQESSSVVEAVSAEDIGKLPDTSIAESLARLPGLAGERVNGRTSGVSVRGFNEDYVATTMNGRELLGIGDNRGVEYDLYPSEIVTSALVYKSPDASLINQGLGGIVDLRTLRPLDNERIIAINANIEQNGMSSANPDFSDRGHRLAFTFSDTFNDGTMGFAVTLATMDSPSQEQQVRMWGFPDGDEAGDWAELGGPQFDAHPDAEYIMGGHDTYVRSGSMQRDTLSSIFQWAPNDRLTMTADLLYIDFKEEKVFRGLEEGGPVWGGTNFEVFSVEDGLVTSGQFDGFHSVIRNDAEEKTGDLTAVGFNAEYLLNNDWTLTLDAARSESTKSFINMESYSGVGRARTPTQGDPAARSWTHTGDAGIMFGPHNSVSMPDYTDPNVIRLAGPQNWGGAIADLVGTDNAQDGFINQPMFDEDLTTLRLSADGDINLGIFNRAEVGINYSDRSKSKVNYGAYLVGPGFTDNQPPESQTDVTVPEEFRVGNTDLSFVGLGEMLAYDSVSLYQSGFYREIDATRYEADRLGDTWTVDEKITTLYGMLDFEHGFISGNIGLQAIHSDQWASGFDTQTERVDGVATVVATPTEGGDDFWNFLPSLNMTFAVTDNQYVRFAASQTMSRARLDDMRPNTTIGFDFDDSVRQSTDPERSAWSGTSGSPELRPLRAYQADLGYEWYFADEGVLAAGVFYKDLRNWHFTRQELTDFSEYIIEGYHDNGIDELRSTQGFTSHMAEAGSGSVKGLELQASVPFYLFSDILDGFGFTASATFLDGEITDVDEAGETVTADIPGLSERIYQATLYYEKNGFEARISGRYRDKYATEFYGLSMALTPTTDQGAEIWDAQIGYDFGAAGHTRLDGLSVTLQAQNLTNESTISASEEDSRRVNTYQSFGANYMLGVNYRF